MTTIPETNDPRAAQRLAWARTALDDPQASLDRASTDAGFRSYWRSSGSGVARIVMDSPPDKEDVRPWLRLRDLLEAGEVRVPQVLARDAETGFLLLEDLGPWTYLQTVNSGNADEMFDAALDQLLNLQQIPPPADLPTYDAAMLARELRLFDDWFCGRHLGLALTPSERDTLEACYRFLIESALAQPQVLVHRDFMPRNLMLPTNPDGALGVLDFQDALYGPASYDIASLMRDAFLTWDEEFVLDITVRYWERARKRGLMDFEDWHSDFGSFWRAVEWMGLQRHLKVAGIFARLTLRDGKPKYLADAPRFIAYIRHTAGRYRELAPLLKAIDQIEGTEAVSGWAYGRV